jgi:signal transduction histidine kinase/HD-like signal output (HDOD) protein/ActR/RegA family two-component response regulator
MPNQGERLAPGSRPSVKGIVRHIENLPSPPAVATTILSLVVRDDMQVRDVAGFIESDPALAMRVLKLANSAYYGRAETLTQAITLLGLNAVKNVLLSIAVRDTLFREPFSGDPELTGLWKHSLACAVAAELLAGQAAPDMAGQAFAAGLAHDCGKLVLLGHVPGRYGPLLLSAENSPTDLADMETAVLGVDHCLAGKWLAEAWGLPRFLADAVWLHHQPPEQLAAMGREGRIALLTAAADRLAHEVMSDRDPAQAVPARRAAFAALGIPEKDVPRLSAHLGEGYAKRADIFDLNADAGTFYFQALTRANARLASANTALFTRNDALEGLRVVLGAMCGRASRLAAARDVAEVLSGLAEVLCECGARQGAVYLRSGGGRDFEGRWWEAGRAPAAFLFPEGSLGGGDLRPPGFVLAGLEAFAARQGALSDLRPPVADGCLCVQVPGPGGPAGEMVFWPGRWPPSPQEAMAYRQLAESAGACLSRQELLGQCRDRAERLAATMREMRAMSAKLVQTERLAAVGQLAAGAAHEINNPLAIIYARVQLLELKEQDQAKKKSLRQVMGQIERISAILTNLMNFARPAPPAFTRVDVGRVLEKTLSLAQAGLERQRIAVVRDLADGLPPIQGDAHQLEQVLLNLIINAEHAMEKGGRLTVATRYDPGTDAVAVEVADTGVGIPKEHLDKVFDPFFTTKDEGKGTGLGLSTAYAIVTAHQGEIRVDSAPGAGTRVVVTLPGDRASRRPDAGAGAAEPAAPPARGILVVDDERHIRDILTEALGAKGYAVTTAATGDEALERLGRERFGLVILDIRMPGRSGLDVLRDLKARGGDTPVLVLTGLAGPGEMAEATALGAAGCMTKPFQIASLVAEIRRLTGQEDGA